MVYHFYPPFFKKDAVQQQHEYLYWEFHEKGGRQAIRKGNWKAVKYSVQKDPLAPIERYNLSNDIGEEHNLAKSAARSTT